MYNYLKKTKIYEKITTPLIKKSGVVLVKNICDSGKIYLSSQIENNQKLIIVKDERDGIAIVDDYKFYDKEVYYFSENDLLFSEQNIDNDHTERIRFEIIKKIINKEKITVVATIQSLLEKIPKINIYEENIFNIKINMEYNFDSFLKKLIDMGYERNYEVENIGDFSVRGSIIDIYDEYYKFPIRIEFFGDNIESIRYFNIDTKRSIEIINEISIHPKRNIDVKNIDEKDLISLIDYFDDDTIIFIDEVERIIDKVKNINDLILESEKNRMLSENEDFEEDNIYLLPLFDYNLILDKIVHKKNIQLTNLDDNAYGDNILDVVDYNLSMPYFSTKDTEILKNSIKKYLKDGFRGIIITKSGITVERLVEDFINDDIKAYKEFNLDNEVVVGNLLITKNELSNGFIDEENKLFIFTEKDIFGIEFEKKNRVSRHKKLKNENYEDISSLSSLSLGDYIVHEQYGVGIYKGLTRLESDKVLKDYITIEYADGGILYVLATKLDTVYRYASKNAKVPKINTLYNNDFYKSKKKLKEEVLQVARDLIDLYAKRMSKKGFRFQRDTIWQKEFEETFPYVETDDQIRAIEQIKQDMESDKSMDRLVCGDVGFGKTELALRAAFKAVQDSKQVAILVPTTILCMQHFKTFSERFKNYPVRIDYLSRFKTSSENKKTVEKIKNGQVDIIVGTHRLLSNDIEFYNLGLLVVDEEQRFGVSHKEKIKRMRSNVDVLTLSATPIPRTLYMSLSGIRDLSLLTEAPPERVPIKTYVFKHNKELIREAIERELKRDGQVFIVHNKVFDIYEYADKIRQLCPNAKIAVAHGKLDEQELAETMDLFINKQVNVLISTTIIETGIDIQNANTLIVDNAEDFGLAQLYQLRGRVGRSERTAYAFFLYSNDKNLTEESEKRLRAIKEFKSLGSGIKIAMRDLEIRGAGNVLGLSQSGHIDAVGYELYMKLLNKALKYVKEDDKNDEEFINSYDTIVDIDIDAYIKDDYEPSEQKRIEIYRKIAECQNEEDFSSLYAEIKDEYGFITKELENLFLIAKLKIKANDLYITDLNIKKDSIKITFYENAKIDSKSIVDIINEYNGKIKFYNGEKASLHYKNNENIPENIEKMLEIANKIIEKIKKV